MDPNIGHLSYDAYTQKIGIRYPYYDKDFVAAVKKIPAARWDDPIKTWWVPKTQMKDVVREFYNFKKTPAIATMVEDVLSAEKDGIEASKNFENADLEGFRVKGNPLFEHQKKGARRIAANRRLILAFEMGLGKTATCLVAAKIMNLPIIVVGPKFLRENWIREAKDIGVSINYRSAGKMGEPPKGSFFLIADEAHYFQTWKSQRTKSFLAMAAAATVVVCVTGTPMKNGRPCNLFPLLKATRHQLSNSKKIYEEMYCAAGPTRWSAWDASGASNLDKLHEETKDIILYCKKEDCLDLPPKLRVLVEAELEGEAETTYWSTLAEIKARYLRGESEDQLGALRLLMAVRQAGAWAKVHSTVEKIEELVETGHKVTVFTTFVDVAKKVAVLSEKYGSAFIVGDTKENDRTAIIDRFQSDPNLKVLALTYGSGGVGITLTAADTTILLDRPWTPGDAIQAESRHHRIGQKNTVTCFWQQIDESDKRIDEILQRKYRNAEILLTGQANELEFENDTELVRGILRDVLK